MDHFQFATIFAKHRKELKVTQEEIADFIGVSRAAVSKWEKGQSYPDLSLLPKLATYFNISIDDLLGYKPQMTKEQIIQTYSELAEQFSKEPFEIVQIKIEALLKEYYACFPFVLKMAQLYINYFPEAKEPQAVLERVIELCMRVKAASEDLALVNEATIVEAFAYLQLQQPEEVLELLGNDAQIHLNPEQAIAEAHTMLGNTNKAKEVTQGSYYQHVIYLIGTGTEAMMLEATNQEYVDDTVEKMEGLINLFDLEKLHVNAALLFYYKAAHVYASSERQEEALTMLQKYVRLSSQLEFPITLQGDDYFYLVSDWIEDTLQLGNKPPRDELSIKKSIVDSVIQNPVFEALKEREEFKAMVRNLANHLKVEVSL